MRKNPLFLIQFTYIHFILTKNYNLKCFDLQVQIILVKNILINKKSQKLKLTCRYSNSEENSLKSFSRNIMNKKIK